MSIPNMPYCVSGFLLKNFCGLEFQNQIKLNQIKNFQNVKELVNLVFSNSLGFILKN